MAIVLPRIAGAAQPHVFWASDPVLPDQTVMVQGSDLAADVGDGKAASVELARVGDDPARPSTRPADGPTDAASLKWVAIPVLQASEQSLKFVVPADWPMGVYAMRISAAGATSDVQLLNAPDPWWMQGEEGASAVVGSWLRVLGKNLGAGSACRARLSGDGLDTVLSAVTADGYSARFDLPPQIKPGSYQVRIHNGFGGQRGWRSAGTLQVVSKVAQPGNVFNVLDSYGPDATREMRNSLIKYNQPIERTAGVLDALKKAKENGGGIVYFPAGRYTLKAPLVVPDHTLLRGEGEGLVTLWWGTGHFNLDGGGPQGRKKPDEPKPPHTMIFGADYGIEDLSIYLPLEYEEGIVADKRMRMNRVRIRIDHGWMLSGRGEGTVLRLGGNYAVTDCDITAKGTALVLGEWGTVWRNRIMAMKCNTQMGGAIGALIENNLFESLDPTAYQNIAGSGRDIYYAHNKQEALYAQQSDYSFTFDAGGGGYIGKIAQADGTRVTLAADPTYPKWAPEQSRIWHRSAVCILDGRGAGQWRDVVSNHGRDWQVDRPFDVAPDETSVATIVPFNGRVLVIGNRFEDANWVNAGYGTSIDVVCADNQLVRCADMMNYGVKAEDWFEPSWYVQFLNNTVTEGQTQITSNGDARKAEQYSGPLTRCAVHRGNTLTADNSGTINAGGNMRDMIIEDCTLQHPMSLIKVDGPAQGIVVRNNKFAGDPRYAGDGLKAAVVVPPAPREK